MLRTIRKGGLRIWYAVVFWMTASVYLSGLSMAASAAESSVVRHLEGVAVQIFRSLALCTEILQASLRK